MPTFEFTSPDGKTYEVTGPDGATQEQAFQMLQGQHPELFKQAPSLPPSQPMSPQGAAMQSHYTPLTASQEAAMGASQAFGVPYSSVDPRNAVGAGQRFTVGALSDNPAEQQAVYEQMYPGAKMATLPSGDLAMQLPSGEIKFSNAPGMDWGDMAQFAGQAGPAMVGTAAAVAAASNPWTALGAGAAAAGGAELVREGVQALAGTQRETPAEYGGRAAFAGGSELALGGLGRGASALTGAARKKITSNLFQKLDANDLATAVNKSDELAAIVRLAEQNPDLPLEDLMRHQRIDDPVVKRIASQVLQLSGKDRPLQIKQLQSLKASADQLASEIGSEAPDATIQKLLRKEFEDIKFNEDLLSAQNSEVGGQALIDATGSAVKGRRATMGRAYSEVDKAFAEEQPVFDLSASKAAAQRRRVEGLGIPEEVEGLLQDLSGKPLTVESVQGFVNVSEPAQKVARINALLSELDPAQTNYEVLKEIRTQVGKMMETNPVKLEQGGVELGQLRKIYGTLSDDLMNVKGAPKFQEALKDANAKALKYYDSFRVNPYRAVIGAREGKVPSDLFYSIMQDPKKWDSAFTDLAITEAGPKEVNNLRVAMRAAVDAQDNPIEAMAKWREKRPDIYKFIYPDEKEAELAADTYRQVKALNSGDGARAFEEHNTMVGIAQKTLDDAVGGIKDTAKAREAAMGVVRRMGGDGSEGHRALRSTVWENIMDGSFKYHPDTGVVAMDPSTLAQNIEKVRKKGYWGGVLTRKDTQDIEGLLAYAKRTWKNGDAGTGLTLAAQTAKLRHFGNPKEMVEAGTSIFAARRLAGWFTSDAVDNKNLLLSVHGGRWNPRAAAARSAILQGARSEYGNPLDSGQEQP